MKKLLALLTALCLALCALPALAEDAPAPAPAPISTAAYTQAMEAFTGLELEWLSTPMPEEGLTATVCTTMGSPALLSSGDALITITTVSLHDPEELQETFDAATFQLMMALGPVCIARGTAEEDVFTPLAAFLNAEGFIPAVISVLTTGEPFSFTFEGYPCTLSLETVGDQTWVSLFIVIDSDLWDGV